MAFEAIENCADDNDGDERKMAAVGAFGGVRRSGVESGGRQCLLRSFCANGDVVTFDVCTTKINSFI